MGFNYSYYITTARYQNMMKVKYLSLAVTAVIHNFRKLDKQTMDRNTYRSSASRTKLYRSYNIYSLISKKTLVAYK